MKKIYLVKKDGIYCFFAIDCNNHLKQLCGGYLRKTNGHNIEYYYSRMTNYTNSLHKFLGSYFSFQKRVSDEIKSIGGVGKIHGCIVDIDFFNHLFINPYDRKIIPYYAEDTSEQLVFENLISLLKMTHPVLETKTNARLMKNKQINSLLFLPSDKIKKPKKTTGNNIYGLSRLIYNLQVTNNFNIIRIWNDKLASTDSEETGRLIFEDLVIGLQNKK